MVPSSRLLWWVAVVVIPFALLAAVEPASVAPSLMAIGTLTAAVLADAWGARPRPGSIRIALPNVIRLTKNRPSQIEVRIQNVHQKPKKLHLALALPGGLASSQEAVQVLLPPAAEWSRISWPCSPRRRGRFQLEAADVETPSVLGFWLTRSRIPLKSEVRVYPNLFADRRSVASFFLHRGSAGLHAQRQVGRGREFEKLREYVPGDNFDEIHWKTTAKRGRPVTKVFQVERTREVYVIIDASRLSARITEDHPTASSPANCPPAGDAAPSPATSLERFVTAALTLGLAAQKQGDLFGLLTFTDKVETFVRAQNGKSHYATCRDALYALEPRIVTPDYDDVFTFIRLRLRRRALLVFLTSLDDPVLAESFARNTGRIGRQHLVLVNMLRPRGVAPLFSNAAVSSADELYQHLGGHLLWRQLRELEKVLQRQGVQFSLLENERLMPELVARYLNVKQRQLL